MSVSRCTLVLEDSKYQKIRGAEKGDVSPQIGVQI